LANLNPASRHLLIEADLWIAIDGRSSPRCWACPQPKGQRSAGSYLVLRVLLRAIAQVSYCISDGDINSLLRRFWEDEEIHQPLSLKKENKQCEQHFVSTHSRILDGRYMVRLPFKTGSPVDIGDSLLIATALYVRLKSRLQSQPEVRKQYDDFLREYREFNHMELMTEEWVPLFKPVYIPHHAVIHDISSTTKLRVVFNASCKTRNGT